MDEATRSLSFPTPKPSQGPSMVLAVLARRQALALVKHQLKARGERVALLPMRYLSLLAEQYLAEHRIELLAETWAMVLASPALRAMFEQEQRKRQRQQVAQVGQRTTNNATVHTELVGKSQ